MALSLPLLLLPLWLSASAPEAELRAPAPLALPGYRLHLIVDEEIDPDRLRALARPGVVLWMRTRSNMVRSSIAEALGRFGESYVALRPPVLEAHLAQLRMAPGAGVWLEDGQLGGAGLYRIGSRRLALEVKGALDSARAERIRKARPARVAWTPGAAPDLEGWAAFAQLPGAKLLVLSGAGLSPWEGCSALWARGAARSAAVAVDLRGSAESFAFPTDCRLGARLRVSPRISDGALARLLASNPAAELELDPGSDEQALREATALLDRLDAASASVNKTPPARK